MLALYLDLRLVVAELLKQFKLLLLRQILRKKHLCLLPKELHLSHLIQFLHLVELLELLEGLNLLGYPTAVARYLLDLWLNLWDEYIFGH